MKKSLQSENCLPAFPALSLKQSTIFFVCFKKKDSFKFLLKYLWKNNNNPSEINISSCNFLLNQNLWDLGYKTSFIDSTIYIFARPWLLRVIRSLKGEICWWKILGKIRKHTMDVNVGAKYNLTKNSPRLSGLKKVWDINKRDFYNITCSFKNFVCKMKWQLFQIDPICRTVYG